MPTRWETLPIEVSGGLISNLPPIQQGLKRTGSAIRLQNFEPSVEGGYRRINGYAKWDSAVVPNSGQIFGVTFFEGDVIAVRGADVYTSVGAGWTSIQGSRTHTTKHRFHQYNFDGTKKVVATDGVNYPWSWDGTTFTNINATTDVQGASHAVDFKNHMFYAKGNLVTFSEPFDEEAFSTGSGAGSFQVQDPVTGFKVFRSRLFIFTEKQIKVVDGSSSSDFVMSSVSEDIGCVAEDTIQEVGGDVMFLAQDGLRLLGGTEKIGDFSNLLASKEIQSDVNDLAAFYTSFSSVVVRQKSQYRLLGFTSGRDNTDTDGVLGAQIDGTINSSGFEWSKTRGLKAYSSDSVVYEGEEYIIFCDESDYVYRMENGASNYDGTAIQSSYWTPYVSFNDPMYRKTLHKADFYITPEGSVSGTVSVNFDLGNTNKIQPAAKTFGASAGGEVFGGAVFGSAVFEKTVDTKMSLMLVGSGFNASFQFEFTEDNDPFIIDTILVAFKTNDRK